MTKVRFSLADEIIEDFAIAQNIQFYFFKQETIENCLTAIYRKEG